ncbi:MAG: hypothetical protein R2991_06210 [Thermoanaerobaculia bacterium]
MSFAARFLTLPDLFPARPAGSPCGEHSLDVALAGGPYRIQGLSARQHAELAERYGELCRPSVARVEIDVFAAGESDFVDIDTRGWRYELDLDQAPDRIRIAGLRFMAWIGLEPRLRGALWTCVEGGARWTELFENYFRILVSYRLLAAGGVLLHSAGVADADGAWVFFGHSGAGKTTISRLSRERGRDVLSDDINAVHRDGDRILVSKMPFAGDLGRVPGGFEPRPLRGIYRLEKGEGNRVAPLPTGRAVAALLSCAPFVNQDPHRVEELTGRLEGLVSELPVGTLAFDLTGDFWTALGGTC